MEKILEVKDLTVQIGGKRVIEDASFDVGEGEILGLVGESGSGKTLTALSTLGLLPGQAVMEKGAIFFRGENILSRGETSMREIRGNRISMVFQEPFTALNPVMRVGEQIREAIAAHRKLSSEKIGESLEEVLRMVELEREVIPCYPHELSGGMRQKVCIAMALSCGPDILLLDEPTTALDVTVQKTILDLIKDLQSRKGFGVVFITHDLSVVERIADSICVMRKGRILENGNKDEVLRSPKDAYTRHLIACIPKMGDKRKRFPYEGGS